MSQFNIDPTLSMYELTKRNGNDIELLNHVCTMSAISYEIENASLYDNAKTTVFASFQLMSRFLPQQERYCRLAQKSEHVYILGVLDCELPHIENLTFVPLQLTDQLFNEWFVVSYGENYSSALATRELSDTNAPDSLRTFQGIWSFDTFFVSVLYEWLSGLVGLQVDPDIFKKYDYEAQTKFVSNIIKRMDAHLQASEHNNHLLHEELTNVMQSSLYPAYQRLIDKQQTRSL